MIEKNNWRSWCPIAAVVALFVVTRALAITQAGSLWFDEAFSAHFSAMPWAQMWAYLKFEHNPLLPFAILHGWIQMFGDRDWILRLPSALAGLGSLLLIYIIGSKLFNRRVGTIAALLMTISTLFLYHQTEARMYSLVVFFALAWFYAFLRWREAGERLWLVVYTLSAIALVQTHLTAWPWLIALVLIWWLELPVTSKNWRAIRPFLLANGAVLVTFLLWFIPVFLHKIGVGQTSQAWFLGQNETSFFGNHLVNFLINGENRLPLRTAAAILIMVAVAASRLDIAKPAWWQQVHSLMERDAWPLNISIRWTPNHRLLVILLIVTMLLGFAGQVTVTKYLIVAALPLFLLMAEGLDRLSSRPRALMIVALIAVCAPLQLRLLTEKRHHWDEVGQAAVAAYQTNSPALLIVHTFADVLPLQRYLGPAIIAHPLISDQSDVDAAIVKYNWQALPKEDTIKALTNLLGEAKNASSLHLILVSSTVRDAENDPVKTWLWQNGWRLEQRQTWDGYGDPELLIFSRN